MTKEGILLGYFLSLGSVLVSQQDAKIFNTNEHVLIHELHYIQDKYMWVFNDQTEGLDYLKQQIKAQFNGLDADDIIINFEEVKNNEI